MGVCQISQGPRDTDVYETAVVTTGNTPTQDRYACGTQS